MSLFTGMKVEESYPGMELNFCSEINAIEPFHKLGVIVCVKEAAESSAKY